MYGVFFQCFDKITGGIIVQNSHPKPMKDNNGWTMANIKEYSLTQYVPYLYGSCNILKKNVFDEEIKLYVFLENYFNRNVNSRCVSQEW